MSAEPKALPKTKPGTPAPSDERDAAIERLERALAEERQSSGALRASVEDLRFKLEVVEKSYLKQLSDARVRRDAAEQHLNDKEARFVALDRAMDETLGLLKDTHDQLERLAADHERLCKEIARRDGVIIKTTARTNAAADNPDSLLTIDDLLASPVAARDRPAPGGHLNAQVATPADQPAPEMIPAELVFPQGKDEDGEDEQ